MKFSGKMCFKIILKVTKNQGFILSLEDKFFEKPQVGGIKFRNKEINCNKDVNIFDLKIEESSHCYSPTYYQGLFFNRAYG